MKGKLFIVEGPDCSGKTSLATFMCRVLPAVYLHASGARTLHPAMLDYHLALIRTAEKNLANDNNVVMDRLWVSEYCYGQVLRPHMSDRVYDFPKILHALERHNPTYIFCGDKNVVARHEEQKDQEHAYSKFEFEEIVQNYEDLEREMQDDPPIPLLHYPGSKAAKFNVVHYAITEHGHNLQRFVELL